MENRKGAQKTLRIKLLSVCTTLLLLFAVVCGLFFTLQSVTKGYVSFGGYSVFRVITGSMEPQIPTGALLLSQRHDIEDLSVGDIVCFRSKEYSSKNIVITHRITDIYSAPDGQISLQTKGDANLTADARYVTEDQLIGRVIWHTGDGSKMAKIINFLTSDFGFLACIIVPVAVIAIWIFKSAVKSMRKAIKDVEKQLEQEENAESTAAVALTQQEYDDMYQKLTDEIRKELEQSAEESEKQAEDTVAQSENENADTVGEAQEPSPASTNEEPSPDTEDKEPSPDTEDKEPSPDTVDEEPSPDKKS